MEEVSDAAITNSTVMENVSRAARPPLSASGNAVTLWERVAYTCALPHINHPVIIWPDTATVCRLRSNWPEFCGSEEFCSSVRKFQGLIANAYCIREVQ